MRLLSQTSFLLGWPVSSTGLKFDVVFSFRIIKKNFYNYVQFSRYKKGIRQPPALPCRRQHSTIGRLGLNHRVRDGNGCVPQAHRRRNLTVAFGNKITEQLSTCNSLERSLSSRTFRYGYLVTTSPQSPAPPSTAPSFRLGHWLRAFPTPMV